MSEVKYISRDEVQKLNEKHGWFEFSDAQSDVSNAFANDAIRRYEQIRVAAPELLEAVTEAIRLVDEDIIRVLPGDKQQLIAALELWNSAVSKATGLKP